MLPVHRRGRAVAGLVGAGDAQGAARPLGDQEGDRQAPAAVQRRAFLRPHHAEDAEIHEVPPHPGQGLRAVLPVGELPGHGVEHARADAGRALHLRRGEARLRPGLEVIDHLHEMRVEIDRHLPPGDGGEGIAGIAQRGDQPVAGRDHVLGPRGIAFGEAGDLPGGGQVAAGVFRRDPEQPDPEALARLGADGHLHRLLAAGQPRGELRRFRRLPVDQHHRAPAIEAFRPQRARDQPLFLQGAGDQPLGRGGGDALQPLQGGDGRDRGIDLGASGRAELGLIGDSGLVTRALVRRPGAGGRGAGLG
ncbi:hypothetical protein ROTAS13_01610 [Roseomonas sp. TAS13]|nr:hypothetical protein ROTAS13_01610 [Roseomonas sp. TAS13]